MSSLALRADEIEQCPSSDALIFQPISSNCRADYKTTEGMIRRIVTDDGEYWTFCSLLPVEDVMFTGAFVLGNKEEIIKAAEYQCGATSKSNEWIVVKYSDPDFPQNLIPR